MRKYIKRRHKQILASIHSNWGPWSCCFCGMDETHGDVIAHEKKETEPGGKHYKASQAQHYEEYGHYHHTDECAAYHKESIALHLKALG